MEPWVCSDSFLSAARARLPLPSARSVTEHSSLAVPGGAGSASLERKPAHPTTLDSRAWGRGGAEGTTRLHLFLSQSVTVVGCAAEKHCLGGGQKLALSMFPGTYFCCSKSARRNRVREGGDERALSVQTLSGCHQRKETTQPLLCLHQH